MTSWHTILCCDELSELPHHPRYRGVPPTVESTKHFENLLQQAESLPQQDDPDVPLALSNYQEGILSVARFGDPTDVHWPVRYFAVSALVDETMDGIIEIDEKKVQVAEAQGILEDRNASMIDRFYGKCPEHPNLEFYIRYHPLREEPLFSWEEEKIRREKCRVREGSPTLSELDVGPEDLIPKVKENKYVSKIDGDFPDGNPLEMVFHSLYPYRGDLPAESMPMDPATRMGKQIGGPSIGAFHCWYPYQGDLPDKEPPAEGSTGE